MKVTRLIDGRRWLMRYSAKKKYTTKREARQKKAALKSSFGGARLIETKDEWRIYTKR